MHCHGNPDSAVTFTGTVVHDAQEYPDFNKIKLIAAVIILLFVCLVVGRLSRIITPVPQLLISISEDGALAHAITSKGLRWPISLELLPDSMLGVTIEIPGDEVDRPKVMVMHRFKNGDLIVKNREDFKYTTLIRLDDISLKPKGYDLYVLENETTSLRYTIRDVLLIVTLGGILIIPLFRGQLYRYTSSVLCLAGSVFSRYDVMFLLALAIMASVAPMGYDIPIITKCVDYSNKGVDIYAAQIAKKMADNFPWPAFPYPPLTLALMSPIQWINDEILSPLIVLLTGHRVPSAGFSLFGTLIYFIMNLAILAEMHWLGALPFGKFRTTFYCSALCPGILYLVAGFQQVDILGVSLLGFGLLLIQGNRDRFLGSFLIAISLTIKPQNLIIALVIGLFFARRILRTYLLGDIREKMTEFLCVVFIAVSYVAILISAKTPSYVSVISGFSIIERLKAVLWEISPDYKVYSMPVFVVFAFSLLFVAWRPCLSLQDRSGIMAMLAVSTLICAYQASIVHTPGLSMFMALGLPITMALVTHGLDRLGLMLVSLLAIIAWPLSLPGDITRPFSSAGYNEIFGGFPENHAVEYYTTLSTFEFIGLFILVALFVGTLYKFNESGNQSHI